MIQKVLREKPPDIDEAKRLVGQLHRTGLDDNQKARVLRCEGEISEAEQRFGDTLNYWKQALELDPKVGIKRRYETLRKKL